MSCTKQCKVICIIGILVVTLNALICSLNHTVLKTKIDIPKWFSILSLVAGIVALVCTLRWMRMSTPNITIQ